MKTKALCCVIAPVLAVGGFFLWPHSGQTDTNLSVPLGTLAAQAETTAALVPIPMPGQMEFVELQAAVEQGVLKAKFSGNGRDKVHATLTNTGASPVKVQIDAGQMLECGKNALVVVRSTMVEIEAGKTAETQLQTVSTRSTNKISEAAYTLSYHKAARLDDLLAFAQNHLELSTAALQTAALALVENLPLSAVAKFTPATGELTSRFNTNAFRVETIDIIAALNALQQMKIPESSVAMTIDPQLKIESMIEPLSRAAAMRYYGITTEAEWDFWKTELLNGVPATRHYALYGIARFYPEIALDMLPKWARETKTNSVYRLAALQALADTQRMEALPILRQLTDELGSASELGRAARGAADYLDQRLTQIASRQTAVSFRASKTLAQF